MAEELFQKTYNMLDSVLLSRIISMKAPLQEICKSLDCVLLWQVILTLQLFQSCMQKHLRFLC